MTPLEVESFEFGELRGELAVELLPGQLESTLERLIDPGRAGETLHWGRNYLYAVNLETADGPLEVVVKQFRNQGFKARLSRRLKGSKATRSWRIARLLAGSEVLTPSPVMLIESIDAGGPSYYVCERLSGCFEVRHFFRALENGREADEFPQVEPDAFFEGLGTAIRRLHDGGVLHRDLSVGNVLVKYGEGIGAAPDFYLVDLNRARLHERPSIAQRMRDLSRLRIFGRADQERFLRSYWNGETSAWGYKFLLYRVFLGSFLTKNRAKAAVRKPFRELRDVLVSRSVHAHIPAPPEDASKRDKIVWDHLSDQPHQHANRRERLAIRLADIREHGRELVAAARAAPDAWDRYRELKVDLYQSPTQWAGVGVAVRPHPKNPEGLIQALEDLGVSHVYLRLHPWEDSLTDAAVLAHELRAAGFDLTFGIPQNRELVQDMVRWTALVSEIAARFQPYGHHYQVGQAVNRSKWGIWHYGEYLELAAAAMEILRVEDAVKVVGPAVIDFEFYATLAILNQPFGGHHFDAVSSLLYVDRRGAPENTQLGFDTVDKVALLKAIAETSQNSAGASWITEFNWPLWEGPHSPAGRSVSVDEETQADYLVRFYLLALGTGLVERVYWWQTVARGYGLIDPSDDGTLRRRPAFHALANMQRILRGSSFVGPIASSNPSIRLYRFQSSDDEEIVVGWSTRGPARAGLPCPAAATVSRDGEILPSPLGVEVEVTSSPRYFWLRA